MKDVFWLENLANASYKNGKWTLKDNQKINQTISQNRLKVMPNLFDLFKISIDFFNQKVEPKRKIKLLSQTMPHPLIKVLMSNIHTEIYMPDFKIHVTSYKVCHFVNQKIRTDSLKKKY